MKAILYLLVGYFLYQYLVKGRKPSEVIETYPERTREIGEAIIEIAPPAEPGKAEVTQMTQISDQMEAINGAKANPYRPPVVNRPPEDSPKLKMLVR